MAACPLFGLLSSRCCPGMCSSWCTCPYGDSNAFCGEPEAWLCMGGQCRGHLTCSAGPGLSYNTAMHGPT